MRRTAALIVGGGPAGCAAAITLARGGLAPELIERSQSERDVVCGGFLGWDALAALGRLGIDAAGLGARPIHRLRLLSGRRRIEADLPRAAAGLSRRRLDAALLALAESEGAVVTRGRTVRAADAELRTIRFDDGEEMGTDALFLATGKHELRGMARPLEGREAPAAGLRTALPASPALEAALQGVIELHLFDAGYAGLLLQEDGSANLCLSVSRARLTGAGGVERLIEALAGEAPVLGERIGASVPTKWEAVAGVPYGWRAAETEAGCFRIGDQSAVIASLAGDGIAIALRSGIAAAEALLAEGPEGAPAFQRAFFRRSARPVGLAEHLRHRAEDGASRERLLGLLKAMPFLVPIAARLTRIG